MSNELCEFIHFVRSQAFYTFVVLTVMESDNML